jgi:hypothetical protein
MHLLLQGLDFTTKWEKLWMKAMYHRGDGAGTREIENSEEKP